MFEAPKASPLFPVRAASPIGYYYVAFFVRASGGWSTGDVGRTAPAPCGHAFHGKD
jgi:hypothetical protein